MTYLQAIEYLFDQGVIKVVMSTGAEFTIKEALRSAYQIMASGTAYSKADFLVNAGSLGVFRTDEDRRFPLLECQGWTKAEVEAARVLTEVKVIKPAETMADWIARTCTKDGVLDYNAAVKLAEGAQEFENQDWEAEKTYFGFEDGSGLVFFASGLEIMPLVEMKAIETEAALRREDEENYRVEMKDKIERRQAARALGSIGGSSKSEAKAEAVRKNGAKGGRPKKDFLKQEFRFTPTRNGRQTAEQGYTMTAGEFIMLAEDVADRGGTSLEAFAEIELIGVGEPNHFGQYSDYKYARTLEGKERFEVALKFEANRIDCRIDSKKVTK